MISPTPNITQITVGFTSSDSFNNSLVVDDLEFDSAGAPVCSATQNPTVTMTQPTNGQNVQFDQFLLAFSVATGDPFATTTVMTGLGLGAVNSVSYPGFNGTFGPTWMSGLLFPGTNTLTVAVNDCRGSATASATISYFPIAAGARFHVLGFKATQAVQNIPSSVPLIVDKPTLVRVYLKAEGSTSQINAVRGTLFGYRPLNNQFDRGPLLQGVVRHLTPST